MRIISILLTSVLLYLSSCAPSYVPNIVNTPLHTDKGEAEIATNFAISGFDPQASYAITEHIGIMVNGSFADRTSDTTNNFHKHNFLEGGVGYFTLLNDKTVFECYTGYGYGMVKAEYSNELWKAQTYTRLNRVFLQPAIGVTTNVFTGSFATRIAYVNLYQNSHTEDKVFLEPVLTAKMGYKYIQTIVQLGISFPVGNNETMDFNYQPFILGIGIQANINKVFNEN